MRIGQFHLLCTVLAALTLAAPAQAADCAPTRFLTPDEVFASSHMVFAHYFYPFPLSIDNRPGGDDYYADNYLNPHGEKDKWLAQGGYLRSRPLPVPPGSPAGYQLDNMEREVTLALSRGIGGFTFDIMGLNDLRPGGPLDHMLQAAEAVDPRFRILLMPDMGAMGPDTDNVLKIAAAYADRANLMRSADGKMVIAPFMSEKVAPDQWVAMLDKAAAQNMKIVLMPTFLSLDPQRAASYASFSGALGTFGTAVPAQSPGLAHQTQYAHDQGKPFMAGLSGQDYRPKDNLLWEAGGSLAYRNGWTSSIAGGADWIQLTTWSDFSESTQIEPYTDALGSPGLGYFDLTGYYAKWYLTGRAPEIASDTLYYFYRKEPAAAASQQPPLRIAAGSPPAENKIELLAFLTMPGQLQVTIGGHTVTKMAPVGITSVKVPLQAGTPDFRLIRHGQTIVDLPGKPDISGNAGLPGGFRDMTYWSGGATQDGQCAVP